MKYCEVIKHEQNNIDSDGVDLLFTLEDSTFAQLNLIPKDPSKPMSVSVDYRLVNKLQERFVYETLILLGVGMLLIVLFGLFLYKALSSSLTYEMQQ